MANLFSFKNITSVVLIALFMWMIIQGLLTLLPDITGIALVAAGFIGLVIVWFLRYKNILK